MSYIPKQYRPKDLEKVLEILQTNYYHNFQEEEAKAIVKMFHLNGYRIIKTGIQE